MDGLFSYVMPYVDVWDRIVLTGACEDTDPDNGAELTALNVGAAQFFTNAISTKTKGVDIILSYRNVFGEQHVALSLAGNVNDMELGDINVSPKLVEQGRRQGADEPLTA